MPPATAVGYSAWNAAAICLVLCRCALRWVTTWDTRTASAFSALARSTSSGTVTWAPMFTTWISR